MKRSRPELALLLAILLMAAALRLPAIDFDLPYILHPDEPAVIRISRDIFAGGDLNPHFFDYPSLVFYANALAYTPLYLSGRLTGEFDARDDIVALDSLAMGAVKTRQPAAVLLNRGLSLLCGLGTVVLLYAIGRVLYDRASVGLVAALLLAVWSQHAYHSRIVTTDAMVTFFIVLAFFMAALIFRQGNTWHYVGAGLAVGLATGTKYNGGMIALAVPLAHFLRAGWGGWRDLRLYASGVVALLTFLLTTPYAILDYPAFSAAFFGVTEHYGRGHAGMEGDTLAWYTTILWTSTTITPLLALVQIGRGLWQRSKPTLLLAAYPVAYFLFIIRFEVRNDRTILPIVPFLFLLAAVLLVDLAALARRAPRRATRWALAVLLVALIGAMVIYPAGRALRDNRLLAQEPSPITAANWISANLEPGARVVLEAYGPYLDPAVFDVTVRNNLAEHPPEWYAEQGFDYLIAAGGMYGRYVNDPARYPDEARRYEQLFERYELVRAFEDGLGRKVRIYLVR